MPVDPSVFRSLLILLVSVLITGCASIPPRGGKRSSAAERLGSEAVLAGEWEDSGRLADFVLFKPDPVIPKSGRVIGLGDFDAYKITTRSHASSKLSLELMSSEADTTTSAISVQIELGAEGRVMVLHLPRRNPIGGEVRRHYRKVRR